MNKFKKAYDVQRARLILAKVLDHTGGDTPENADIATAESRLYDYLARQSPEVKKALREYFGDDVTPG